MWHEVQKRGRLYRSPGSSMHPLRARGRVLPISPYRRLGAHDAIWQALRSAHRWPAAQNQTATSNHMHVFMDRQSRVPAETMPHSTPWACDLTRRWGFSKEHAYNRVAPQYLLIEEADKILKYLPNKINSFFNIVTRASSTTQLHDPLLITKKVLCQSINQEKSTTPGLVQVFLIL